MGGKLSILVVEDDEKLAELNSRLLLRRGYEVVKAFSASQARDLFGEREFDLIILDVMLPDGDGFELCAELRQKSDAPVLFLTGKDSVKDKVEGLSMGGDYYLTKPFDYDEFMAVVQSLLRRDLSERKKREALTEINRGPLTLDVSRGRALVNGRDVGLTQKEFAILLLLVKNEGRELTGEQIYEAVWEMRANSDTHTVRNHMSRLRGKLGVNSTDAFSIFTDYGKGYCFISAE